MDSLLECFFGLANLLIIVSVGFSFKFGLSDVHSCVYEGNCK